MLTFACPECRKHHDWPDDWLGERVDCPECGKLITLSNPQRDRRDEDDTRDDRRDSRRPRDYDEERREPRRRGRDYDEDDRGRERDVSRSIRRRDYEDDYDDRFVADQPRREVSCPRCDYVGRPSTTQEMAENAWLLIVLGILFWPLIILGILMKQKWEVCPECRFKIRKVGGTTFG